MSPSIFSSRIGDSARSFALVLAVCGIAGCAAVDKYFPSARSFGVYKLDINQGNYLSQDMVDKLRVGQTKQQVRTILGTPLVASAFRDNRWDYIYEFQRQGRVVEHRAFTAYFADDKLARWEGDEMPQSVAELNREAATKSLPKAEENVVMRWLRDVFRRD